MDLEQFFKYKLREQSSVLKVSMATVSLWRRKKSVPYEWRLIIEDLQVEDFAKYQHEYAVRQKNKLINRRKIKVNKNEDL